MMGAFEEEFHGIRFRIPGNYYETVDGLSWGVNPTYAHEWNGAGESEIKLQISRRETPTLAAVRLPQCEQSYFGLVPFAPAEINCLACQRSLLKRFAPVISAIRRATFMISEYTRTGHSISR